jgi:hypothetical protein
MKIAGIRAGKRTRDFMNTKHDFYPLSPTFDKVYHEAFESDERQRLSFLLGSKF